jgi:hypothetical protein
MACDGLFKGLTPAAAVALVAQELAKPAPPGRSATAARPYQCCDVDVRRPWMPIEGPPPGQAAVAAVVNEAVRAGSTDNVTAVLLVPGPAPTDP